MTTRPPSEIKYLAEVLAASISGELYDFLDKHRITNAALATKLDCSPQAIGARRKKRHVPTLEVMLRMIFAIEDLTGATFERPTFVREKPRENAKYLGKIKEK